MRKSFGAVLLVVSWMGCESAEVVDGGLDAGSFSCRYQLDSGVILTCVEERGATSPCALVMSGVWGAQIPECSTMGIVGRCYRSGSTDRGPWSQLLSYYWPETESSARDSCAASEGTFSLP